MKIVFAIIVLHSLIPGHTWLTLSPMELSTIITQSLGLPNYTKESTNNHALLASHLQVMGGPNWLSDDNQVRPLTNSSAKMTNSYPVCGYMSGDTHLRDKIRKPKCCLQGWRAKDFKFWSINCIVSCQIMQSRLMLHTRNAWHENVYNRIALRIRPYWVRKIFI